MQELHEMTTLDKIRPGISVKIVRLMESGGDSLQRLAEMGFVEGQRLSILKEAPFGDPISVQLMNYELCLRKSDASHIEVEVE